MIQKLHFEEILLTLQLFYETKGIFSLLAQSLKTVVCLQLSAAYVSS